MKISRIWILNLVALIILVIVIVVGRYSVSPPKKEIKSISEPSKIIIPGLGLESKKPKPQLLPWQKRKGGISPEEEWANIEEQMKVYFEVEDDQAVKTAVKEMRNNLDNQIKSVKEKIEKNPDNKTKRLLLKDLEREFI
jgi:hypothetical protein